MRLLSPFAPHIACELWSALGYDASLPLQPWPAFDPVVAAEEALEIPVQVNGKIRERLTVPVGTDQATLERLALDSDAVRRAIGSATVRKVIVVPGKLVNIVTN